MNNHTRVVELDVRTQLRSRMDPFELIMSTVKSLSKQDTFVLHATFKPTPLLGLMKLKGYKHELKQVDAEHWEVTFRHKSQQASSSVSSTPVMDSHASDEKMEPTGMRQTSAGRSYKLDNRGLQPPQPMIRTLSQLEKAAPGDTVMIHNDRVPMFLIEELNSLGYPYTVKEQADGSALIEITRT